MRKLLADLGPLDHAGGDQRVGAQARTGSALEHTLTGASNGVR
jgi:hypothetical protein